MSRVEGSPKESHRAYSRRNGLSLFRGIQVYEVRNDDGSVANYAARPTRLRSVLTGVRHNTVLSTGETPKKAVKGVVEAEKSAKTVKASRNSR